MRVGFVGLGVMGGPMAGHLHDKGVDVTVWNRSPERRQPFAERGIPMVWIHRGMGQPPVPAEAVDFCRNHDIDVVDGACPLMFDEPVHGFHRVHRFCAGHRIAV